MKLVLTALLALTTSGCALMIADGFGGKSGGDTVVLCHKGQQTLKLPRHMVGAHLDHGDTYGPC